MDQSLRSMKVAFLTPYYSQGRGNTTTARRIYTGLKEEKIQAKVVAYEEASSQLIETIEESDLLHVLHFRRFSDWLQKTGYNLRKPYLITSGGTDVNIDIFQKEHKEKIRPVLANASLITVFSLDAKQKLQTVYPEYQGKIQIIKQSVWLPENEDKCLRENLGQGPHILLPAGLRKVKDVLFVLQAIIKLKNEYPQLTFTILGSPIEENIVKEVKKVVQTYSWVSFLEEIPLEQMSAIYRNSDLIVNTSISEGQSSALLEAMLLEKPVIARINGGNESIIKDGETGFLFADENEFYEKASLIFSNETLRKTMVSHAKKYVLKNHALRDEISHYLKLYKEITSKTRI